MGFFSPMLWGALNQHVPFALAIFGPKPRLLAPAPIAFFLRQRLDSPVREMIEFAEKQLPNRDALRTEV